MPERTCPECGRITAARDSVELPKECDVCGHNHQTDQAEASSLSDGLASKKLINETIIQHMREYVGVTACRCEGVTMCWKCVFAEDLRYFDAC